MKTIEPIYTPDNCTFAYQLRWGVTLFLREYVPESLWRTSLSQALESDDIRVLSHRSIDDKSVQFSLSSKPAHSPAFLIQRLNARLQYALRDHFPKAFRPHYSIRSFGTQDRAVIEAYVAKQPSKHRMTAERSQMLFEDLLYVDHNIDLSCMQKTSHGAYWFNLHVVLVNEGRWCDVCRERLEKTKRTILKWSIKKRLRLSRCAILADHMHLSFGCPMEMSPETIVLSLMNTVVWVYEMKPVLDFSAFIGTFGDYDQRAVLGSPLPDAKTSSAGACPRRAE